MKKEKTILVIDDSNTALLLMEYVLSDAGYRTHISTCVKDAIAFLEKEIPDMVLLDLSMPEISGYDFLNMRTKLHLENTPILAVSAYDSEDSVKTALTLGALEFIPKPIQVDLLLEKIKVILNLVC
jgi:DNA-binding NtrC family response regulator